jgi:AcrR family transcriptional regulator
VRTEPGLSKADVAERVGCHRKTVDRYFKDRELVSVGG